MDSTIHHRGQPGRAPAPPALVDALLDDAGLAGPWTVESVAQVGWINRTTIVRLADDHRVVVRQYDWPFVEAPRYDRRAKEVWLHPRLAAAGVPVADILGVADVDGISGALLSWFPGEPLGVVAQRVGPDALADAWREAGAALGRAHGVAVPGPIAGFLSAEGVLAMPDGSFAGFHRERIAHWSRLLAERQPDLGIDVARIDALIAAARPTLEAEPLVLGHSDAHAWNLLVAADADGRWHLSGWLDWEMAWVGDAAWDHMRMTVQRFAPIGPTPDGWWEGYGGHPPALNLAVAVLHFMLWKSVDDWDTRDRAVAHAWLADLPAHLSALEALLP